MKCIAVVLVLVAAVNQAEAWGRIFRPRPRPRPQQHAFPDIPNYSKAAQDCSGNDIRQINGQGNLNGCRDACNRDNSCKVIATTRTTPYTCWLKRDGCGRGFLAGLANGARYTYRKIGNGGYNPGPVYCGGKNCGSSSYCDRSLNECQCNPGYQLDNSGVCQPACTCKTYGDPHYFTYDGERIDFMGICKYTLSKSTKNDACAFNVELKSEHKGWFNNRVSYVRLVDVKFAGTRFRLAPNNQLYVDRANAARALPYSAHGASVIREGKFIVFTSHKCGIRVQFSGPDRYVEVQTSRQKYSNHMTGMCGNCNGNRGDDMTMCTGGLARGRNRFSQMGVSCSVPDDSDRPSRGCKVVPPIDTTIKCNADRQSTLNKPYLCGYFKNGPFAACIKSGKVDAAAMYSSCRTDVCAFPHSEERNVACKMLSAFASQCTEAGFFPQWRSNSVCPLPCPANSVYNPKMRPCRNSCKDKTAEKTCAAPFIEGCACKSGFILEGSSGIRCIRARDCSKPSPKPPTQIVYTKPPLACGRECPANGYCDAAAKECRCKPWFSFNSEETKCEASCVCQARGDPHYHTYDGQVINFYGKCKYTLTKSQFANDPCAFDVQVKNEVRGRNTRVSYTRLVDVVFGGKRFRLHQGSNLFVDQSNAAAALPFNYKGATVKMEGRTIVFVAEKCGIRVTFDGRFTAEVRVPRSYKNNMVGICGNCNGNKGDDFTTFEGINVHGQANAQYQLGSSFSIPDDSDRPEQAGICKAVPTKDPVITCSAQRRKTLDNQNVCGMFKTGPFEECIDAEVVDANELYENCKVDVCAYRKAEQTKRACAMLSGFAASCRSNEIYPDWRTDSFCPLTCPANSEYSYWMNACPNTCKNRKAESYCEAPDIEGCKCKDGYILEDDNGHRCIKIDRCGGPTPKPVTQIVYTTIPTNPPTTIPTNPPPTAAARTLDPSCVDLLPIGFCDNFVKDGTCSHENVLAVCKKTCSPSCKL